MAPSPMRRVLIEIGRVLFLLFLIVHFKLLVITLILGITCDLNFKIQVADVKNCLGSVYQMVKSGNRVIFDSGGGSIHERGGSYEIDLWVQSARDDRGISEIKTRNRFRELEEESEEEDEEIVGPDFIRRDERP